MTDTTERTVRPDFWLVKFDQTQYWRLPPEQMQHVERIVQVLLFDRNEITHCCEITPSYCLFPVETRAEYKDPIYDGSRESERLRDQIDSEIRRWQCHECEYHHCHRLDDWLANHADMALHRGDTGVDFCDTPYDEQREAMIEHCQCNQQL